MKSESKESKFDRWPFDEENNNAYTLIPARLHWNKEDLDRNHCHCSYAFSRSLNTNIIYSVSLWSIHCSPKPIPPYDDIKLQWFFLEIGWVSFPMSEVITPRVLLKSWSCETRRYHCRALCKLLPDTKSAETFIE